MLQCRSGSLQKMLCGFPCSITRTVSLFLSPLLLSAYPRNSVHCMISGLAKMDEDDHQDSELAMGQFEAQWRNLAKWGPVAPCSYILRYIVPQKEVHSLWIVIKALWTTKAWRLRAKTKSTNKCGDCWFFGSFSSSWSCVPKSSWINQSWESISKCTSKEDDQHVL